ncbi:predicted protein [Nematostella vectensis]|nr:predicted protein [Nematostella vectensis]|eukprot:XP_001620125.1 hypothetical protein NEMVEDRAFT_v1g223447 [Nematostella vectensis]
MLVCGLYHPPKPNKDLIGFLAELSDGFLDSTPEGTVVLGGELNKLDLSEVNRQTGLIPLVDFPTGGDSKLDNCLTNAPHLFAKSYPTTAQTKTDHLGFIVPAAKKLKPIRTKLAFRDCRQQYKDALYKRLVVLTGPLSGSFPALMISLTPSSRPYTC